MKHPSLLFLFYFFSSGLILGQSQVVGTIFDANTSLPIEGVNIKIEDTNQGTTSDQNGLFRLDRVILPYTITFSHIGYETQNYTVEQESSKQIEIYLVSTTNQLNEITISTEKESIPLSKVDQYSTTDFELVDQGILRLQDYGVFKKHAISLTNFEGESMDMLKLKNIKNIHRLHKSCNGVVYILTKSEAIPILIDSLTLSLEETIAIDTFKQFILPCKFAVGKDLFYLTQKDNGLTKFVTKYNTENDTSTLISVISNEELAKGWNEEKAFIEASQKIGNITTNSYAVNVGIRNTQERGDFLLTVFFKPEFPVFIFPIKEKIVVFNHTKNKIESYKHSQLLNEVTMDYVEDDKWLKKVIFDSASQKTYGLFDFENEISLKEIDIQTGKSTLVSIVDIPKRKLDEIRIYNNEIYYLKNASTSGVYWELLKVAL